MRQLSRTTRCWPSKTSSAINGEKTSRLLRDRGYVAVHGTQSIGILHAAAVGPRKGCRHGLSCHGFGQRIGDVIVRALHILGFGGGPSSSGPVEVTLAIGVVT